MSSKPFFFIALLFCVNALGQQVCPTAPMERRSDVTLLALLADSEGPYSEAWEWALAEKCGWVRQTPTRERLRSFLAFESTLPQHQRAAFESWKQSFVRYVDFRLNNEIVIVRSSDAVRIREEEARLVNEWIETIHLLETGKLPKTKTTQHDEKTWPAAFSNYVEATLAWVAVRQPSLRANQVKALLEAQRN